jgi:AraC-like DNA-binding protein
MRALKAYIDAHCAERLTQARLARVACVSTGKLKYVFKAAFGKTVFQYVTEARMERACALLARTAEPVSRVAEAVGYQKASAFSAAFARQSGILPRDYRRACRQEGPRQGG